MNLSITEAIQFIKDSGVPISRAEKEIGVGNGLLGKILSGNRIPTDDVSERVLDYVAGLTNTKIPTAEPLDDIQLSQDSKLTNTAISWDRTYGKHADNDAFDQALKVFHAAIKTNDRQKIVALQHNLHSQMNVRQTEAIAARCQNWLVGNWGKM